MISDYRRARFDYHLEESFEAGLALEGWEVKSLRAGRVSLAESYVMVRRGEIFWVGGNISPLLSASTHVQPSPTRDRKLLLHAKEIRKLIGKVEQKGYTLVPLSLYWKKGRAKLAFAVGRGKKLYDKRAAIKERDWNRQKQKLKEI